MSRRIGGGTRFTGIRPVTPASNDCISRSILESSRVNANSNFRIRFDASFSLDSHFSLEEISWKVSLVRVVKEVKVSVAYVKGQYYQLPFLMDIVHLWYILNAKAICVNWISNLQCTMFVVRMFCVIIGVSHYLERYFPASELRTDSRFTR
jgi:hypothetical protein